jgi:hypothetical protein
MKENIIRKLTSRKFWVALVGFITPLLLAFGVAESDTAQITAIIIAGADVLGYLLAEGLTDAAAAGKAVTQEGAGDEVK